MEFIQQFKNYLFSQKNGASKATVKNYVADVKKFIAWFELTKQAVFAPQVVTPELIQDFKKAKITELSASSLDRHISSLKKFFSFLKLEGKVPTNPFERQETNAQRPIDPWHIKEFKDFLYVYNASHLTIKNYLIDVKQFFAWAEKVLVLESNYILSRGNVLSMLDDRLIQEYSMRLQEQGIFSPASINRKLSSLRKYINWASVQGYLSEGMTTVPANILSSLPNEANELIVDGSELMENKDNEIATLPTVARNDDSNTKYEIAETRYSPIPPIRLFQKITKLVSLGLDYLVII